MKSCDRNVYAVALILAIIPSLQGQQDEASVIYAKTAGSVLLILSKSDDLIKAEGTGFIVSGGKILTNNHVIEGGTPIVDVGGARVKATIEAIDRENDLALLSVPVELSGDPLTLSDSLPVPGTTIFTIGNPRGLEKTISTGVVSGVRSVESRKLVQITTPISPGSSGGPVFDRTGKVIAITVATLQDGQNLNFAVPAEFARELLTGKRNEATFSSLLDVAQSLVKKRSSLEYSDNADSPYSKNEVEILGAFTSAVSLATKGDVPQLIELAKSMSDSWSKADQDAAVICAEKALALSPRPDAYVAAAKAYALDTMWLDDDQKERRTQLLDRSEAMARKAISSSRQPTAEMYYRLGYSLNNAGKNVDADVPLRRALELNRTSNDLEERANILRILVDVADALKNAADCDKWFGMLASTDKVNWWDWTTRGKYLDRRSRFSEAGDAWRSAAQVGNVWSDWCEAAASWEGVTSRQDEALAAARQCITKGTGQPNSAATLALAHRVIATVLNGRAVYEEALTHATEAIGLEAENAWNYDVQAAALQGLQRWQEEVNASKQAIRLSDGKFYSMHFHLGYAYFQMHNWQFSVESFERAAQIDPSDDDSAYNVALGMERLGYSLDAAHWYEEALKRNPNRTDKADVVAIIARLRASSR